MYAHELLGGEENVDGAARICARPEQGVEGLITEDCTFGITLPWVSIQILFNLFAPLFFVGLSFICLSIVLLVLSCPLSYNYFGFLLELIWIDAD